MTKEEAIKFLNHRLNLGVKGSVYYAEREALKLAIEALESQIGCKNV